MIYFRCFCCFEVIELPLRLIKAPLFCSKHSSTSNLRNHVMHFYTYSCVISVSNGRGLQCVKGTFHAFSGLAGVLRTLENRLESPREYQEFSVCVCARVCVCVHTDVLSLYSLLAPAHGKCQTMADCGGQ